VVEHDDGLALLLPGPPRELQALWPQAVSCAPLERLLERASPRSRRVMRFYGVGESVVGEALADAGGERIEAWPHFVCSPAPPALLWTLNGW